MHLRRVTPHFGVTNLQPAAGYSKFACFSAYLSSHPYLLGKNSKRPIGLAILLLGDFKKRPGLKPLFGRKKRIVISQNISQKMNGGKKVAGGLVKNITFKTLYTHIYIYIIHRYIKYHIIGILSMKFSGLKNCKWIHNI